MIQRWNQFWFAPGQTHLVCMVRIWYGVWLFCKKIGLWGLHDWADWNLRFPRYTAWKTDQLISTGFRAPVPGFGWIPDPSLGFVQAVDTFQMYGAVLVALGLFTPVIVPLIAASILYQHVLSQFSYVHHVNVYTAVFLVLAFARAGDHYSLDALLFRRGRPPPVRRVTSLRALQVLVSAIYLSTAYGKLNQGWFDGTMMRLLHDNDHFKGPLAETIWSLTGPRFLCHVTLFSESLCAFGFWIPQLRLLTTLSGMGLHTGIDLLMPVTTFSYQMMSLYVIFLDPVPGRTRAVLPAAWWHARWPLRALNWLDRVSWAQGDRFLVTTADGRALGGVRGFLEILLRLPATFPLAFVLLLPRTLWGIRTRRTTPRSGS